MVTCILALAVVNEYRVAYHSDMKHEEPIHLPSEGPKSRCYRAEYFLLYYASNMNANVTRYSSGGLTLQIGFFWRQSKQRRSLVGISRRDRSDYSSSEHL
jgi:hypothetical protein